MTGARNEASPGRAEGCRRRRSRFRLVGRRASFGRHRSRASERERAPVRKRSASSDAGPRGVELRCELGKLAGVGERCVGPTRELLERFLTRVKKPLD